MYFARYPPNNTKTTEGSPMLKIKRTFKPCLNKKILLMLLDK